MTDTTTIRLALVQENATVGDLAGNAELALQGYRECVAAGADLIILPELFLTGYPPEDLLLIPGFVADCEQAITDLAGEIGDVPLLIGAPVLESGQLRNAAVLMQGHSVVDRYSKTLLPNYGPFDEQRYFAPATAPGRLVLNGVRIGVTVCEDLWQPDPVASQLAGQGVELLVNLSASPYHREKPGIRQSVFAQRAAQAGVPVAVCNLVGGQDELVFDGRSFVVGPDGGVLAQATPFVAERLLLDVQFPASATSPWTQCARITTPARKRPAVDPRPVTERPIEADVIDALCLGLRDYVTKNGFPSVLIGLSGGIDSALVALLAARALGADRVHTISMPSRFNSEGTRSDARDLARGNGLHFEEISIEPVFESYLNHLGQWLGPRDELGITAENLQARIRGQILMAFSNRFGHLVLATGNKSELAMGYATLYGDMAGGYAVIKDLTKGWVYRLTRWLAEHGMAVPDSILTRPPSAELRPDQKDQDSLPPYDVLDAILEGYVEQNLSSNDLIAGGHDPDIVRRVLDAVDRNEYKRRQAAPGIRISGRIFGKDRRMPITQRRRRR